MGATDNKFLLDLEADLEDTPIEVLAALPKKESRKRSQRFSRFSKKMKKHLSKAKVKRASATVGLSG